MNNNTLSCFTRSLRFSRLHVCVLTHFVLLPLLLSVTEYEYGPYTYIVTDNNEAAIIYYDGDNANVSIPSTLGGYPVAVIGDDVFEMCDSLKTVTIPNSVKSIGNGAFCGCDALKSVTIGNSVTNIGDEAFSNCSSLTNITVSAGNPKYADRGGVLFDRSLTTLIQYPCGRSGSYTIPGDVTSIGAYAFSWCAALTSVMISNGVANIGNRAFTQCGSLAVVLFTGNAPTAGNLVFDGTPATLYYFPDTEGWSYSFANRPAVCWNPAFSSTSSASGMFAFTLTGDADANIPVRIEASDSLTAPFWSAVTDTTIPASGTLNFTDAGTRPSRFYRLTFLR